MSEREERPGPDEVGSLAEEASKLFGVLAGWAQDQGLHEPPTDPSAGTEAATCAWCPVCRAVHWVRGTDPEVRAHLAAAATSLAQAATAFLAAAGEDRPGGAGGPGRQPPVQHIDLDPDPPKETGP